EGCLCQHARPPCAHASSRRRSGVDPGCQICSTVRQLGAGARGLMVRRRRDPGRKIASGATFGPSTEDPNVVNDANTESGEVRAFRERARRWLAANVEVRADDGEALTLPVDRQSERAAVERARTVQRCLFDAGLAGITWPKECGGQGLPIEYHRAFWEEAAG